MQESLRYWAETGRCRGWRAPAHWVCSLTNAAALDSKLRLC